MRKLSNMKLGKKIGLASGAMVALLLCTLLISLWSLGRIKAAEDESGRQATRTSQTLEAQTRIAKLVMYLGTVLMHEESATAKKCNSCHEFKDKSQLLAPIDREREAYSKTLRELVENTKTEEGKRLYAEVDRTVGELRATDAKVIDLWKADKMQEAWSQFKYGSTMALPKAMETFDKVVEFRKSQMDKVAQDASATVGFARLLQLLVVLLGTIAAIPFALLIARDVTRPIAAIIEGLGAVAHGDMSKEVPSQLAARGDEAGDLAKATQQVIMNLRPMIRKVADGVQTLSASSTELSSVSGQMTAGSRQTSERADAVAAAAEEMSASMLTLTTEMDQANSNLTSVATATEQMTATIGEIAANSEKARRITTDATHQATQVSESVGQLGQAAQRIGKVTETISNISAQTNLLALNATIEAARAGAAGKGFAVVANEIKDLAQQTAKATEDIKDKVTGIQSSTSQTIVDIGSISQTIRDVSEIVSSIATAIEEQAAVTKDIAGNIAEASIRVQSASEHVTQSSHVTTQIAEDVSTVTQAASNAASGSTQVSSGAADLSKLAENLRHTVEQFKL